MHRAEYTDLELRQIILRRRRGLTERDSELAKQLRRLDKERIRIAEQLADLDIAERLLE
ncbi:hypothetical protein [Mycolicibacter kumamotonensis]|uniref:hypothetical protein n=1 Tax=Mycolicibacter kumamotonensis TaxID=354243 RepID=UPI0013F4C457|nr:hypothetical protein [Mycolicibacter kumamotonensis]